MNLLKVDNDDHFQKDQKKPTSFKMKTIGAFAIFAVCALIGCSVVPSKNDENLAQTTLDDSQVLSL